ncbi:TetR/AcrR family transcriptional regulator [Rhodococcus koreensis]
MSLSRQAPVQSSAVANRAAATREALVRAARVLFVEKGYFDTATEEIVAAAGVGTRGALYHHFTDKRALFRAVFELVESEQVEAAARFEDAETGLEALRRGIIGYLEASPTPEVQRILLIDGPAVLGWEDWRALEEQYGLGSLRRLLERAVVDGSLPAQPLGALSPMLLAAVNEAAIYVAGAQDSVRAKAEALEAVDRLLDGLARRVD